MTEDEYVEACDQRRRDNPPSMCAHKPMPGYQCPDCSGVGYVRAVMPLTPAEAKLLREYAPRAFASSIRTECDLCAGTGSVGEPS